MRTWITPEDFTGMESQRVMCEADADRDFALSKEEILAKYELFVTYAADMAPAFHDEL